MDLLLGIDIGTTSCKACAMSIDGHEVASSRRSTPWERTSAGTEADPQALIEASIWTMRDTLAAVDSPNVLAVGIASMAETGVLINGRGDAAAPAIAWYDERGQSEVDELEREFSPGGFASITGLPSTRLCSLVKCRWLIAQRASPRRGGRWLSVAEWIAKSLGAEEVSEFSLASRTGFLDVRTKSWSGMLRDWSGAHAGFLPDLVAAGVPIGRVRDDLPGLGKLAGAVITIAGHDHLAAVVGAGAVQNGDVLDSWGTAEALIGSHIADPSSAELVAAVSGGLTFGIHVLPERYAVIGASQSGRGLGRVVRLLGLDPYDREDLDLRAARWCPGIGPSDLTVRGVTDEECSISVSGFDPSPEALWRAAVEAASLEAASHLRQVERFVGPTKRLVLTGGWARSDALVGIKEAITGVTFRRHLGESAAQGAALLAGCAAGVFRSPFDVPAQPAEQNIAEGQSRCLSERRPGFAELSLPNVSFSREPLANKEQQCGPD